MTITYPTGLRIEYAQAKFLRYCTSSWELYTADPDKDKGVWIASIMISSGATLEVQRPTFRYDPEQIDQERNRREIEGLIREVAFLKKQIRKSYKK